MSDINQRLKELERVAKANEPSDDYKHIYPLTPLEFTKLHHQKGEDAELLKKIWHKTVDDYEQEHLDELQACLRENKLPPWRYLVYLGDRPKNGDKDKPKPKDRTFYKELEKRALDLYEQYKKGQLKL